MGGGGLGIFAVMAAQCLVLQVLKDMNTLWPSAQLLVTAPLALAIMAVHVASGRAADVALLALAASGLLVLCMHGSQSNHVLLEMAMLAAVLLTAPAPRSWLAAHTDSEGGCSAEWVANRRAWESRLTSATRGILISLYAVTATAKLNDGFFDRRYSCCIQMTAAIAGTWMGEAASAWIGEADWLLAVLPAAALVFEASFALTLAIVMLLDGRAAPSLAIPPHSSASTQAGASAQTGYHGRVVLRTLTVLGGGFHALIALPPPPMSVYPFSMLMAPLYASALAPADMVDAAVRSARASPSWARAVGLAVIGVTVAGAYECSRHPPHLFEYPSYCHFYLGVLWVLYAFGALGAVALGAGGGGPESHTAAREASAAPAAPARVVRRSPQRAPTTLALSHQAPTRPSRRPRASGASSASGAIGFGAGRAALTFAPALTIGLVGCAPYLGVRNYPAFAMFSNLELEGGASNHWLISPTTLRTLRTLSGLAADREHSATSALYILDTDLPSLRHLQVNLAPLLPPATLQALQRAHVAAEFYITPPRWSAPLPEPFRPYAVPAIEVRRRVAPAAAAAESGGPPFYVRYSLVEEGAVEHTIVYEYSWHAGQRNHSGGGPPLDAPLSAWRAWLHRFRSFDPGYSPCRH